MKYQKQEGGSGSAKFQAAGSIIVNSGVSAADVVAITRPMVEQGLRLLTVETREMVDARLREFEVGLLGRLAASRMVRLEAFQEPDFIIAAADAQRAYVRSGLEATRRTLIDLVIERAATPSGTLESAVICDAIGVAGRLSPASIASLTVHLLMTCVYEEAISSRDGLCRWLTENVTPFIEDAMLCTQGECDYMSVLNCLTPGGFLRADPLVNFVVNYGGIFQLGVSPHAIYDDIWEIHARSGGRLFEPSEVGAEIYRIPAVNKGRAGELAIEVGANCEQAERYSQMLHFQDSQAVLRELANLGSSMQDLVKFWLEQPGRSSKISALGVAIGYSNWVGKIGRRGQGIAEFL